MALRPARRFEEVFPDDGPLGITWQIKDEDGDGRLDMSIERVRPGSAAAGKIRLVPGIILAKAVFADGSTHNLRDQDFTEELKDALIEELKRKPRPLTLTLETPDLSPEQEETEQSPTEISGVWSATGRDEEGSLTEMIQLEVAADGGVTGAVDDGDGVFQDDDGDSKITKGRLSLGTGLITFTQQYADGDTTEWSGRYDKATDTIVDGQWEGACTGTFTARRLEDYVEPKNLEGYRVICQHTLGVFESPDETSGRIGDIGPGSESVSDKAPVENSGAKWVQLAVKYSADDCAGGRTRKVLRGWVLMCAAAGTGTGKQQSRLSALGKRRRISANGCTRHRNNPSRVCTRLIWVRGAWTACSRSRQARPRKGTPAPRICRGRVSWTASRRRRR